MPNQVLLRYPLQHCRPVPAPTRSNLLPLRQLFHERYPGILLLWHPPDFVQHHKAESPFPLLPRSSPGILPSRNLSCGYSANPTMADIQIHEFILDFRRYRSQVHAESGRGSSLRGTEFRITEYSIRPMQNLYDIRTQTLRQIPAGNSISPQSTILIYVISFLNLDFTAAIRFNLLVCAH